MRCRVLLLLFLYTTCQGQDTSYARQVIKFLTSEKCFGRGYLKNGLANAGNYIVTEIEKQRAQPLFGTDYRQRFQHAVNTFPGPAKVTLNGKKLRAGIDFIPVPSSKSCSGRFRLFKSDSVHFRSQSNGKTVTVILKNKLTFGVADTEQECAIEIDRTRFREEPREIRVKICNKLKSDFTSANIGCYINGRSDSMLVFSAHYDHLGGIGDIWFPGANDNASGVSALLDLIRYYAVNPPEYKMVFLFFAGEEAGLVGSKFFVGSGAIDLSKIKFLINLDLLGTGDDGIMVVNGSVFEKEFALLKGINKEKELVKEIRKRGKAANSDHYWFTEEGVPSFFIYTMGGIKAYHDVNDIARTLPLTDYVDVVKLIAEFAERQ
jgi:aminopeptidase YwaD